MQHFVIGTAGHVDHGKTSLIRALTGEDTDRLAEEKKRGISIEAGFASMLLPDGSRVGIVDVPGHEKFIRNMLAGSGGVDLVLMVVAADEGPMPQTMEHAYILDLLGAKSGIIVLTRADLADDDDRELCAMLTREKLADTFLRDAPLVQVSSISQAGIAQLKELIFQEISRLRTLPGRESEDLFVPVDRVFSVAGHGTVVTGTVFAGTIKNEDKLVIQPGNIPVRVRGLQNHGEAVSQAVAGQRTAVNLAGIQVAEIKRGVVLATLGRAYPQGLLDLRLRLLPDLQHPLANAARVRFYAGAAEAFGRIRLLETKTLAAGHEGYAQIFLDEPLSVVPGLPYVLRDITASYTLGGGKVIASAKKRRQRFKSRELEALASLEEGGRLARLKSILREKLSLPCKEGQEILADEWAQCLENGEIIILGDFVFLPGQIRLFESLFQQTLSAHHQQFPFLSGMDRELVRQSVWPAADKRSWQVVLENRLQADFIIRRGPLLALSSHQPAYEGKWGQGRKRLLDELAQGGISPPATSALLTLTGLSVPEGELLIKALCEQGEVVSVTSEMLFLPQVLERCRQEMVGLFKENSSITMGQMRDYWQTSRKYAQALLEWFDSQKVTLRQGDVRVPGSHLHHSVEELCGA
jgi:selenocysteine-specific elongation factor